MMSANAKERLQKLQAALVQRGVKDVKFFATFGSETSAHELASDVAEVLEAVEAGRARKIANFAQLGAV